jgi:hypothetical protein
MFFVMMNVDAQLVGHWTFDDSGNLLKAAVGNDLLLNGSHKAVQGPKEGDGAVRIGVGSYYLLKHGMKAKGNEKNINEYSFILDIKIPKDSLIYTLFQTDIKDTSDAECFINEQGNIGSYVGDERGTFYSTTNIKANEWYRIGIAVHNDERFDYYIDGFKVFIGLANYIDARFSINEQGVLLFADDDGQDNTLDVADIKLFSKALSDSEMKNFGGYHDRPALTMCPVEREIKPYLQSPTESSIYICWHASTSSQSLVKYGTSEKMAESAEGEIHSWADSTTWHWVKLENLKPNTTYYYQAISGALKSDLYKFKTAPKVGEKSGHIRFAIIGDTRTYPNQFRSVVTSLKEKAKEIYGNDNIEDDLNMVLCNGDIIHYGPNLSQYKSQWFTPLSSISANIPIMVSIGDHEHGADNYYQYMKYEDFSGPEGEKYYSFKYGRVLFISANSVFHTEKQLEWLDNLLADTQTDSTIDWVVVFTHRPGHTENCPSCGERYVQDRMIPILVKYDKVELLTYGHSHAYERGQLSDVPIRLLENGGGGAELGRWKNDQGQKDYPEIQKTYDYWSYTIFDIDIENKKYEAQSFSLGNSDRKMDNELIDSFFREKTNKAAPEKPLGVTDGKISLPQDLHASKYSGIFKILSSQFQITDKQGKYEKTIVNKKRDFENIYGDSGEPNFVPIDKNIGIDLTKYSIKEDKLEKGKKYWWRVRYRDRNLQWSKWSDELEIIIK